MCMKHSKTQKQVRGDCEQHMRRSLAKKPELAELLVPSFGVGCRRITPGPGYLEALCQDNVNVVQQRIISADETGITASDGVHRDVDAIIVSNNIVIGLCETNLPSSTVRYWLRYFFQTTFRGCWQERLHS